MAQFGPQGGDVTRNMFEPWNALIHGKAECECRAVVIVPARNEEATIAATLDALAAQVSLESQPLDAKSFEILLLLNNCTDLTAPLVARWKARHSEVRLHVIERTLDVHEAFVGTARRMLMDTAWERLRGNTGVCAILSTDSDTQVSPDWIAQNWLALEADADAVGGVIALRDEELQMLPSGVRRAYRQDRRYQQLVARLEDRLDPQEGDPWPRHLEHFGASLAVTPQAYARAGGMPPITPLEDVAFVDQLRRVGATLRHAPEVKVFTSSRMNGRVEVGLSGQLRVWNEMSERGDEHQVLSAAWLAHRFRTLAKLREEAILLGKAPADYLVKVDCEQMATLTFRGQMHGEIRRVNRRLAVTLSSLSRSALQPTRDFASRDQGDSLRDAAGRAHAIAVR